MDQEWIAKDRVLMRARSVLEDCAQKLQTKIISIVLYGSKARADKYSQNEYELMILVQNEIELIDFIKLTNDIRLELLREKLVNVKILMYTPDIFEDILYKDKITGTFLYMICRENIIVYDIHHEFKFIKEKIATNQIKSEEEFLEDCIEFAKNFGSGKWAEIWEKTLLQHKYSEKRNKPL